MSSTAKTTQEKEESLTALMHKVLHAPLQPLNQHIQTISTELEAIQAEIIAHINDATGASSEDIDNIKKWVRGIKNTDLPQLKSELAQHLSAYAQAHTQAHSEAMQTLTASIHTHALRHAEQLQATSDALQTWGGKSQQAHATLLERQTAIAAQSIAAQATLLTALGSSQQTLTDVQATQTSHHAALLRMLTQQHTALGQQLAQAHHKLQRLTAVVGMFFSCTLIYVGYGIWHQLH